MELLFGLTEEQMKEVHSTIENSYFKKDVQHILGEIKENEGIDIVLTEAEMKEAIDEMGSRVSKEVYYLGIARDVVNEILDKREE